MRIIFYHRFFTSQESEAKLPNISETVNRQKVLCLVYLQYKEKMMLIIEKIHKCHRLVNRNVELTSYSSALFLLESESVG
jgi:hypothetical protein